MDRRKKTSAPPPARDEEDSSGADGYDDIQIMEDEQLDVYVGETDPMSYRPHQVEGMVLSLLYGSAPISMIRKHARELAHLFLVDAHAATGSDAVSFRRLGLGQHHTALSRPPRFLVPVLNATRKSEPDFTDLLERLMYDKTLRHGEANTAMWELWQPHLFLGEDGGNTRDVRIDEDTDALTLFPPRGHHCSTTRLLGPIVRDYLRESGSVEHEQVYAGDEAESAGHMIVSETPYAFLRSAAPLIEFDAEAYRLDLATVKVGTKMRVFPPGAARLERALSTSGTTGHEAFRSGREGVRGSVIKNDGFEIIVRTDDIYFGDAVLNITNAKECVRGAWFAYREQDEGGGSGSHSHMLFRKGLPGVNVLVIRKDDGGNGDESASEVAVSACFPNVIDRLTFLHPEDLNQVTSLRHAEHFLRERFSRYYTEQEASLLRDFVSRNVRTLSPSMTSSDADDDDAADAAAVKKRSGVDAIEKRKPKPKPKKGSRASRGGGGGGGEAGEKVGNEFLRFFEGEGNSALSPPEEYVMQYVPLQYDAHIDHDVYRPLYLESSADRGLLHLLAHVSRHIADLQAYVTQKYVVSGDKKNKQREEKRAAVGGGDDNDDEKEEEEAIKALPPACKDTARALAKCAQATLQDMAMRGFASSASEENNSTANNHGSSGCVRAIEAGDSPFMAIMYSGVRVGKHGKGFVADKLMRSEGRCVEDARARARSALREAEEDAATRMRNFDHRATLSALQRDMAHARDDITLKRMTPLVGWPQFQLPDDVFQTTSGRNNNASSTASLQLLEEEGMSFQLQFEDREHYAPLRDTTVLHPSSTEASAAPMGEDRESFITLMLEEGGAPDGGREDPLVTLAKAVGHRLSAVTDDPPEDHKETEKERISRESRADKQLRALVDLRNPPERSAQEVNRQIALLRVKKDDIRRRVASAAKNYDEFEAKLIERIKRQAAADHLRRTFLSSAGVLSYATRFDDPRRLAAVANDALGTRPPFATHSDVKLTPITSDEVRAEQSAVAELVSRSLLTARAQREREEKDEEEAQRRSGLTSSSVAAKETAVWDGFKPRIPSQKHAFDNVDVNRLRPQEAEIVTMHRAIDALSHVADQKEQQVVETPAAGDKTTTTAKRTTGGAKKKGREFSLAPSVPAPGAHSPLNSVIKISSSCCLTPIPTSDSDDKDGADHYDVYDKTNLQRIRDFAQRAEREARACLVLSVDVPQRLPRRWTDVFLTYPDIVDVLVTVDENNRERLSAESTAVSPVRETAKEAGTTTSSVAGFQARNAAFAKDPLLSALADADAASSSSSSSESSAKAVEKSATALLQGADAMWKTVIAKRAKPGSGDDGSGGGLPETLVAEVWANLFDTSQLDARSQQEAAAIVQNFLQNGLRSTANELAHPKDAATTRGSSPSAERAHQAKSDLRKDISRLEPESVFRGMKRVLHDVIGAYTQRPADLNLSDQQGWVACAALAYVTCRTLTAILDMSSAKKPQQGERTPSTTTPESHALAARFVGIVCADLQARYRFSHDDVRFDEVIGAQREEEKRKKLDVYKQMTEEEFEELRMYKRFADFDERYLNEFLQDRRRGAAKLAAKTSEEDAYGADFSEVTATGEERDAERDVARMQAETPPEAIELNMTHEEALRDEDADEEGADEGDEANYED